MLTLSKPNFHAVSFVVDSRTCCLSFSTCAHASGNTELEEAEFQLWGSGVGLKVFRRWGGEGPDMSAGRWQPGGGDTSVWGAWVGTKWQHSPSAMDKKPCGSQGSQVMEFGLPDTSCHTGLPRAAETMEGLWRWADDSFHRPMSCMETFGRETKSHTVPSESWLTDDLLSKCTLHIIILPLIRLPENRYVPLWPLTFQH